MPKRLSDKTIKLIDRVFYPIAAAVFGLVWPIAASVAVLLLVLALAVIGVDLGAWFGGVQDLSPAWLIVVFAPMYLVIWAWLRIFERRGLRSAGFEREGLFRKYGRGLIIGLLLFLATLTLLAIFGAVSLAEDAGPAIDLGAGIGLLLIFIGWMVQGGAEELLARGFLLPIIGTRFGTIIGIVVSSLIFSILHLFNAGINSLGLVNLLLFSVFAALLALYEGGLWGVCAVHGIWNWAQGSLFGFRVSGIETGASTIIDLNAHGREWLTGGAFGPEGGAAVTLVYLVGIGLIFAAHRRRSAAAEG